MEIDPLLFFFSFRVNFRLFLSKLIIFKSFSLYLKTSSYPFLFKRLKKKEWVDNFFFLSFLTKIGGKLVFLM